MVDAVLLNYRRIWDFPLGNLCRQDSRGKRGHYQDEAHYYCKNILPIDETEYGQKCSSCVSDVLKSFW